MRQLSKRTQYSLRALYARAETYGWRTHLMNELADREGNSKEVSRTNPHAQIDWLSGKQERKRWRLSPGKTTGPGYPGIHHSEIEGPLAPLPCASETQFRKCDECVEVESCGTRIVMREVRDATAAILERTTLATICRKMESARQKKEDPVSRTYYI
jgi:DNA-binding IscR family transcriptional regulator